MGIRDAFEKEMNETCEHEWFVFSTCIGTVELMLECRKCAAFGTVDDPSEEEWDAAYYAPLRPYEWLDHSRVVERGPIMGFNVHRAKLPDAA